MSRPNDHHRRDHATRTERQTSAAGPDQQTREHQPATLRTAGLRRPGAAALDLAYVAAGFTEGFFETGLQPWDVAAGSLLVTEAGGLIGNFSGESNFLEQKECLAGNPKIYAQLVSILGRYSKFASAGEKAEVRSKLQMTRAAAQADKAGAAAAAAPAALSDQPPAATGNADAPF